MRDHQARAVGVKAAAQAMSASGGTPASISVSVTLPQAPEKSAPG